MTAAPANGITIEYDIHGDADGEPLLLVMGLGCQLIEWPLEFVELLVAQGFRVIRFDNRDIGLSTKIDAPLPKVRRLIAGTLSAKFAKSSYLLSDMADDAASLLDHLGIAAAHIVGVSMGGMIVQTMAIEHPEKVLSLTSIMSNTGDRKHGRISLLLMPKLVPLLGRNPAKAIHNGVAATRLTSGPHFDEVATRSVVIAGLQRDNGEGTARQTMAIAASPDRTAGLGRVTVPTLVIHGLVDPLVLPSGGIATAKAVPGAKLVMYPDMAHDLPRPRWPEIVDEITRNAHRATATGTDSAADEGDIAVGAGLAS